MSENPTTPCPWPPPSPASARHYGPRVVEHLRHPRGAGLLHDPDGTGVSGDAGCGDQVRIDLRLDNGTVTEARFQAFGCPATIAGGSEVVSKVVGRSFLEAAAVGERELADDLALNDAKRACSNLAADALHRALEEAVSRGAVLRPPATPLDPEGVLVAMSGGVDSSAAALLLLREGRQVVGVTFRLWSDPVCGTGTGCCSPETVLTARRVAHQLGIPHLTVDLSAAFLRTVVEDFVAVYARGRTPNPCVRCNAGLRFDALARLAEQLRLGRIATGHYASLAGDPPRLHRGSDPRKDQAYVLACVDPRLLRRTVFPVGGHDKATVRALVRDAGLETHDAQESQEICFIPDDDHRRFLRERLGDRPGDIVDRGGEVLGRHTGGYNFTVGQRKGLGIAAPAPLYVACIDAEHDRVVVAAHEGLEVDTVFVGDLVRHLPDLPRHGRAQLRSSGMVVETSLSERGPELVLGLEAGVFGVAAGQAAVVFDAGGGVVVAGTISGTAKG